jgi:hypothetical protein
MTALQQAIETHRGMYADELRRPFQMTVAQVPDEVEAIPMGDVMVEVTDSGPLGGPAYSRPMNRHLGPIAGYGVQRPWSYSWNALRFACRNDHPGHTERGEFGGSLCWQVVSWCVISNYTPQTIADQLLHIPLENVERHLLRAFRWIEEHMDRGQQIRNARDPQPSEEPTPTRISLLQCDAVNRAVQNFGLEERVWNSQREIQARHGLELPAWEAEWQRRQEALWDHRQECDRCRRAA